MAARAGLATLGLMSADVAEPQVVATTPAEAVLRTLKATFGPLILVQSAHCGEEGGSPVCLPEGELAVGEDELKLGEPAGVPFYCERGRFESADEPRLVLDVARGPAEGFSLEGLAGVHFRTFPVRRAVCEDRPDR
jgi:uncharacterized protein (DUF779 family)